MRYPDWKSVCFGRYLIDIPAVATVTQEWMIHGDTLRVSDGTAEQAKKMALDKITELKRERHETQGTMFKRAGELKNGGILVQGWDFSHQAETSTVYTYVPVKFAASAKIYHFVSEVGKSREEFAWQHITQIASSIHPLEANAIPTEPGCCMGDVILWETPMHRDEYGSISFHLPDAPHMFTNIQTFTVQAKPNPLHAGELQEEIEELDADNPVVLRNGPHPVGPLPGYEICVAGVHKQARFRIFSYYWYAPGEVKNNKMPAINFTMTYMGKMTESHSGPRPFATDQESLETWDKMVNSIRMRPGA